MCEYYYDDADMCVCLVRDLVDARDGNGEDRLRRKASRQTGWNKQVFGFRLSAARLAR